MTKLKPILWAAIPAALLGLIALARAGSGSPHPAAPAAEPAADDAEAFNLEPLRPLPKSLRLDSRRVALGGRLFADPRLSRDGSVSCASCHDLSKGGVDGRVRSVGIDGQLGGINSPTVFNVAFNFKQFWDGRADSLEEQVAGPLTNPKEMGASWEHLLTTAQRHYAADFAAAFPEGLTKDSLKASLAAFLRSLTTPSRFDRHLRGDATALTAAEKEGYELFKRRGCVTCHQGTNVGGNLFSKFGSMGDYFADRGSIGEADLGRFNVTGKDEDRHVFKVPGLRNVELTAPYFHDGSAKTLEEAVAVMSRYQLGRRLPDPEIALIVVFLKTLTAEAR